MLLLKGDKIMKVLEIKDLPDGSGIISFELTDKEKT